MRLLTSVITYRAGVMGISTSSASRPIPNRPRVGTIHGAKFYRNIVQIDSNLEDRTFIYTLHRVSYGASASMIEYNTDKLQYMSMALMFHAKIVLLF